MPVRLFFFQAEDGIRDLYVTGVQTCALPISTPRSPPLTSNGPSSAASGTTSSHRIPIRQIARLFPDEPLAYIPAGSRTRFQWRRSARQDGQPRTHKARIPGTALSDKPGLAAVTG